MRPDGPQPNPQNKFTGDDNLISRCLLINGLIESEQHAPLVFEVQMYLHEILNSVHNNHKLYQVTRCKSVADLMH